MKNNWMKSLLMLTLATLVLGGCVSEPSDSVDQDRIYTIYEVFYDKNVNKTYAKATFKLGNALGTLLQLSGPSEVRFNNDVLSFQAAGSFYEKVYDGFLAGGTFTFKNTKGTSYTNSVADIKPIEFPAGELNISKASTYDLAWTGDKLTGKENVGVLIGAQVFLQINPNTASIPLSSGQLQQINPGAYVAGMERYFTNDLTQPTGAGGSITGKYRATGKSVQIVN